MYQIHNIVYLVISNRFIKEAVILNKTGDLYTIKYKDTNGGIRCRSNRFFPSEEAARKSIKKHQMNRIY